MLKELAWRALTKASPYGPDIDLGKVAASVIGESRTVASHISSAPREALSSAKELGLDLESSPATYLQVDRGDVYTAVSRRLAELGVMVMSIEEAAAKLPWVEKYLWRAILVDSDKYTAFTELFGRHGYFIYVPRGTRVREPISACLYIHRPGTAQLVHNIVVVEEGAELNLVTACWAMPTRALHIGVSEFYVGKGARLTFTMVHRWREGVDVRPRAAAIVEDGGEFVNYYVHLGSARSLQMFPTAILRGSNARAYLTSIVSARSSSTLDIGGRVIIEGVDSRGEVASRALVADSSRVWLRGELVAKNVGRGHIDCKALKLSSESLAEAIPSIRSLVKEAMLTHEAAIGTISRDEVEYLMSKGFSENEATSIIVRGFLEIGIENMPSRLRNYIDRTLDQVARAATL
ncbi:MAG: SufD family Fe-S cluster assembly protein [Crenarchaeota archaeon]|nr:SufD family Fe-S cluster assembly protein [Thermoproteota archaeon]